VYNSLYKRNKKSYIQKQKNKIMNYNIDWVGAEINRHKAHEKACIEQAEREDNTYSRFSSCASHWSCINCSGSANCKPWEADK